MRAIFSAREYGVTSNFRNDDYGAACWGARPPRAASVSSARCFVTASCETKLSNAFLRYVVSSSAYLLLDASSWRTSIVVYLVSFIRRCQRQIPLTWDVGRGRRASAFRIETFMVPDSSHMRVQEQDLRLFIASPAILDAQSATIPMILCSWFILFRKSKFTSSAFLCDFMISVPTTGCLDSCSRSRIFNVPPFVFPLPVSCQWTRRHTASRM